MEGQWTFTCGSSPCCFYPKTILENDEVGMYKKLPECESRSCNFHGFIIHDLLEFCDNIDVCGTGIHQLVTPCHYFYKQVK